MLRLVDIPKNNGKYTWNNCRGGVHQIVVILGKFMYFEDTIQEIHSITMKILLFTCFND
jgi:hypothetical protein